MKNRMSNKILYALYGALAGLFFPIVATVLHARLHQTPLSLHTVIQQQKTEDLFWIIDMAPCVLGILAATTIRNFFARIAAIPLVKNDQNTKIWGYSNVVKIITNRYCAKFWI